MNPILAKGTRAPSRHFPLPPHHSCSPLSLRLSLVPLSETGVIDTIVRLVNFTVQPSLGHGKKNSDHHARSQLLLHQPVHDGARFPWGFRWLCWGFPGSSDLVVAGELEAIVGVERIRSRLLPTKQ